jgi:hypothetical protein
MVVDDLGSVITYPVVGNVSPRCRDRLTVDGEKNCSRGSDEAILSVLGWTPVAMTSFPREFPFKVAAQ